ncbi:MAG: CPBP family intramembrane metalloprotease [Treponema sp.]|nr:CPBP family intramembrane metalloprotease [Treponema sp.]
MKKEKSTKFEILIFCLILLFLIIPPFFAAHVDSAAQIFTWNFPWKQAGMCVFAVVLLVLSKNLNVKKGFFYPSLIALSLLFLTSIIIRMITGTAPGANKDIIPHSYKEVVFCFLTFAFSSVYEEIIYRFYFTDALKRFVPESITNKFILFLPEILGALVFAFAHLYMGFASVINAAVAHIVLRFLYKKTNLIWNCIIVHFIYNVISLILL